MKRIVLVRPVGPRNVGSVLRVIANFGPAEHVLVKPERPSLLEHPDFEQMSHGVEDIASKLRVVETLEEALADCTGSWGFTARGRDHRALRDWKESQEEMARHAATEGEIVAFVFGNEETGLTVEETDLIQQLVRMSTSTEHTSINLAMSVGIVLSTFFFRDAPSAAAEGSTPITGDARKFLTARLVDVLGDQATSEPARRDLRASVERMFSRAEVETRDARAWHLLAKALGSDRTPQDYGIPPQEKGLRTKKYR